MDNITKLWYIINGVLFVFTLVLGIAVFGDGNVVESKAGDITIVNVYPLMFVCILEVAWLLVNTAIYYLTLEYERHKRY